MGLLRKKKTKQDEVEKSGVGLEKEGKENKKSKKPTKKKKEAAGSRWAALILLIVTVLLSLYFLMIGGGEEVTGGEAKVNPSNGSGWEMPLVGETKYSLE